MKYYTPQHKQLTLDLVRSSLDNLDKSNRWVQMGDLLPWSDIEKEYNSRLDNKEKGAGNKPARMVVGAMIVKHKLGLSDQETIDIIRENPYMQYLCGLSEFTDTPIFDSSLFVTIRKRISEEEINAMTTKMLLKQQRILEDCLRQKEQESRDKGEEPPKPKAGDPDAAEFTDTKGRKHKGVLKIDATCADAEVRYPVDATLLETACRKIDEYTSKVYEEFGIKGKTTHYKDARRAYLLLIKQKVKKGRLVKDTIAYLLNCLTKDLRQLLGIFAVDHKRYDFLFLYEKKVITAIIQMMHQQDEMHRTGVHQCPNRIVSIFQPHVRAIVRGKAGANVEFGAKIGASIVDGYTFIDHHSWDAYNEGADMQLQIELYQKRFGYLPSTIDADKIYMNAANRKLLKDMEIQAYCKPLGRHPKDPPPQEVKAKMAKAIGRRNEIECSFGTGKRVYRANDIRAKLPDTARCWTGMCYFVKNVMKFLRELCHILTEIWQLIINMVTEWGYVCTPVLVARY